jgi:outer membrane protein assembly factor BamB
MRILMGITLALALAGCGGDGGSSPPPPVNATVPTASGRVDVETFHNDNARTGQNLQEVVLTPDKVNVNTFGKIRFLAVDGKVDAQPLYLSAVAIPGSGTHNVLYVATEHASVYAFDADAGQALWQVSLLGPSETPSDPRDCSQVEPEIGITATPVIARTRGANGTIYVVAMSKDAHGTYFQRLHALDAASGARLTTPTTIQAAFPGAGANSSGGSVIFDPKQYEERAALLLLNGVLYTTWTSHCDIDPYTGWVIAYDAGTLAQVNVLNLTPNGQRGAIWMSGGGPAADAAGQIYILDGNGDFDAALDQNGFPSRGDFGNAFLKLTAASAQLRVADYFAAQNTVALSAADEDLGSGGVLVAPDVSDASGGVRRLAIGAGKDRVIYVADRDRMGKFDPNANHVFQEIPGVLAGGVYSSPAYFNGAVYLGAEGDSIKAFSLSAAGLSTKPVAQTSTIFAFRGATPSISANGSTKAILWAVENADPAVLHAYDATDLSHELYNSSQAAASRDQFGPGNKFTTPTVVNGKVFVGTTNGVAIFGLLH